MKRLVTVVVLTYVLISGFLCTGSQIHKAKLANADISAALARTASTVITLTQNGSMTEAEEQAILPHISDATVLSDQMEACTNTAKTQSVVACAGPLLTAIQSDMTAASFGLKNPTAQATYQSVLGAVQVAIQAFESAGGVK